MHPWSDYRAGMESETVVADPAWVPPMLWTGFPVLGAGVGFGLTAIADWVASLAWAPRQGLFRLVGSIAEPHATIGALVIGGLAGLAVAYSAAKDTLAVGVSANGVVLNRGGTERAIDRTDVSAAFVDSKQLVLLGPNTQELAREKSDLPAARLQDAFLAHGFPWLAGDPHKEEFRRWIEETPDLRPDAAALLKARAKALSKRKRDDAAALRTELARLGVVVRDEKKRQFWRYSGV